MERVIKCIYGLEPRRKDEYPTCYQVGSNGVTRIDWEEYSPEPYCTRIYYLIYKGDELYCKINDQAVAEVLYEEASP